MRTKIFQLLTCLFALVFCNQSVQAQFARFVESGVIEFEKRVNMYAKIEDRVGENSFMEQAFEQYKRANPQFKAFKYNLAFSETKTRFWPQDNQEATSGGFFGNDPRSEEHTSELQSLLRISYTVLCLKNTTI